MNTAGGRSLLWCCAVMLVLGARAFAQTVVVEDFESGLPTTAPTTATDVTLKSGVWTIYRGAQTGTKHGGSYGLSLSSGSTNPSYATTPPLSKIATITFWARGGGASTMTIQKSVSGGAFTTIASQAILSTYASYTIAINDTSANVRIRFQDNYGTTHYLDDVSITTMSRSTLNLSTSTLAPFGNVVAGTGTPSQSYSVSGSQLSGPIGIKAPSGFRISEDNSVFTDSITFVPIDSVVAPTTIHVRFEPQTALGTLTGSIMHTSTDAGSRSVNVTGTAIAVEPTTQSALSVTGVTGSSITVSFGGGDGTRRLLTIRAGSPVSWLPVDGITVAGVNADFGAAADQQSGNKAVYAGGDSTATVTGLSVATNYFFALYEFNGSARNSENYLISSFGTGQQTTLTVPGLAVLPSSLSFGSIVVEGTSPEKSYTVSGSHLSPDGGNITVESPAGFEVSRTSGSGFASSIQLPYAAGTLNAATVYVRFHPIQKSAYSGNLQHAGGSAPSLSVAVSGTGVDSSILTIKAYYVAPSGNDTNPGTVELPFATLSKAMTVAVAGDMIYMRGGTYACSVTITTAKGGSSDKPLRVFAFPGELPVLDFSGVGSGKRGIEVRHDYWYFRGLEIRNAKDNGIYVTGGYNVFELCIIHGNGDSGMQISDGGHHTRVINCDSYDNYDAGSSGGNADGFSPKLTVGDANEFHGCRAWHNSDDGWDLYQNKYSVVIDSCWTWSNGYDKGNGNGFKTGGDYQATNTTLTNCIAFNNIRKGFDQNHSMGNVTILNCTGYRNAMGNFYFYEVPTSGQQIFKNCISYVTILRADSIQPQAVQETNSWLMPGFKVSDADFVSLDTLQTLAPRKADGSLPDISLFHLAAGSRMINAGANVGLPFRGSAPDLGAFEFDGPTGIMSERRTPSSFLLEQNYPNPFNPTTTVRFQLRITSHVSLKVVDLLGREAAVLVNGVMPAGIHVASFDGTHLPSGVYLCVLKAGSMLESRRMLLLK